MNGGGLIDEIVGQIDDDDVSNVGGDRWAGPLAVNADERACISIGRCPDPADAPSVGAPDRSRVGRGRATYYRCCRGRACARRG